MTAAGPANWSVHIRGLTLNRQDGVFTKLLRKLKQISLRCVAPFFL